MGSSRTEYWFDEDAAARAVHFFEHFLTHTKGRWSGTKFVLQDWQRDEIIKPLFGWKRGDGTRKYRTAYVEIPRKAGKSTLCAGIGLYLLFADNEPGAEIYCLDPMTRVLCNDLRWRPVGDIDVGEKLVAFDEYPDIKASYRKLRTAIVTSADRIMQFCFRITLEDGRTIIASAGHRWLAQRTKLSLAKTWTRTSELRKGSRIRDLGPVWDDDRSHGAGYLAGVFDGEGCLSGRGLRTGFRIAFSQKPGVVYDRTHELIVAKGFIPSPVQHHQCGVDTFTLPGVYNCLRFLGEIRPSRLLQTAADWYVGKAPSRRGKDARVISVEFLGEREVVAIGTSTGTLFAEGLFSHNSVASDRDQAAIVFDQARAMVEEAPDLNKRAELFKRSIVVHATRSFYRVISADAYTKHGLNASGVVFDELHAQPNRELWDVMTTSTGARAQPLVVAITTAGYNRESICWEQHEYARQVLDGVIDDPSYFAFIRAAGDGDDWTDPAVWQKANPGMGVTISREYLEQECRKAMQVPAYQNTFRRLHLCNWTQQNERWLDLSAWDACDGALPDLAGRPCYGGLDMANTTDIAAFLLDFPPQGDDDLWYTLPIFWVPQDNIKERALRDRVPYDAWARDGLITATPGNVIDYGAVKAKIEELGKAYNIREIAYDRWGAFQISQDLAGAGFTMVPFGQGFASMSAPTKELLRIILDKKLAHGGHPVLRWMADNMVVQQDSAGNVKPDKGKSREKIDGMVALIMGLDRGIRNVQGGGGSCYEEHGIITL